MGYPYNYGGGQHDQQLSWGAPKLTITIAHDAGRGSAVAEGGAPVASRDACAGVVCRSTQRGTEVRRWLPGHPQRRYDTHSMNDQNRPSDLAFVQESIAAAVTAPIGPNAVVDPGPFFHGTSRPLVVGAHLTPGHRSNYRPDILMNHIYFTSLIDGAGLAAELAVILTGHPSAHVYRVEPTGEYENDPNVTDKKFPGNPTRSYRSTTPLLIVEEVHDWVRLTDEQRAMWRERLTAMSASNAPILN